MLFNSVSFLFLYLPVVVCGAYLLRRFLPWLAVSWLAAASVLFLGLWEPWFAAILSVSILFNYIIGGVIQRYRRTWMLALGIAANLVALGYFKYANFLVENVSRLLNEPSSHIDILLPLGISFFTFTQIIYLVDVYRTGVGDRNFPRYCLFVSYFPHLIAGPLLHHDAMMQQFRSPQAFQANLGNISIGLSVFAIGLFKKVVIADTLSPVVGSVFDSPDTIAVIGAGQAWLAAMSYALQIYFDFSGYCDMAMGLSLLLGVRMPLNFYSPYKATGIIDFWRRWHMTLSAFLKNYLYVPLGGNRRGPRRRYVNLLLVMLIGGLWHGAAWTFVVWGGIHGLGLIVNHLWRQAAKGPALHFLERLVFAGWRGRLVLFAFLTLTWVFFRSADLAQAADIIQVMFGARGWSGTCLDATCDIEPYFDLRYGLLIALLLAIAWCMPNIVEVMRKFPICLEVPESPGGFLPKWLTWRPSVLQAIAYSGLLTTALFFIVFSKRVSEFLYFQF